MINKSNYKKMFVAFSEKIFYVAIAPTFRKLMRNLLL